MTKPSMTKPTWDDYPVHPAADALPMSTDAEIKAWSEDIQRRGLQHPFIVWEDNTEEADGAEGPFPRFLLDGRGRKEACKLLGVSGPFDAPKGKIGRDTVRIVKAMAKTGLTEDGTGWEVDADPYKMVMSLNVHRRHLTVEQKRQVIADLIEAKPFASDRSIANEVGVSPTTVGDVRRNNDRGVQPGQNDRSPLDRVKDVLRADPSLSDMEAGKAAEVAKSTAHKARHELIEAGEIKPRENPRGGPKPKGTKPKADPKPKPTAEEKAAARKAEKVSADITAVAVAVEQLVHDIKMVVKHDLTAEQIEALRERRVQALDALRTLP